MFIFILHILISNLEFLTSPKIPYFFEIKITKIKMEKSSSQIQISKIKMEKLDSEINTSKLKMNNPEFEIHKAK